MLLDEAYKGAQAVGNVEIDEFLFYGKKIEPCLACTTYCGKNKKCVHKDDFAEFLEKWMQADAVIWSAPVYTMGPPSIDRAVLERLGEVLYSCRKELVAQGVPLPYFLKASGMIVQGSSRFGNQEVVIENMIEHFVLMDCIPVSGDMPHAHLGIAGHVVDKTTPENDHELLAQCRKLGQRVAEVAKIIKIGKLAIEKSLGDAYFCSPVSFVETKRPVVS